MQFPDFEEGETLVFSSPPAKDIKKLLSLMKVDVVVRKLPPELGRNEILVCGGGIHGLGAVLSQLGPGGSVEHVIPKPDCSQQRWVCGGYALRFVLWAEDLLHELATGKHRLCIIEGAHPVALRSGAEECVRLAQRSLCGHFASRPKTHYNDTELLTELVRISPATKYVFACHMKGQGISRERRTQFQKFPQVIKVMGRTDSVANQRFLLRLIRELYAPSR